MKLNCKLLKIRVFLVRLFEEYANTELFSYRKWGSNWSTNENRKVVSMAKYLLGVYVCALNIKYIVDFMFIFCILCFVDRYYITLSHSKIMKCYAHDPSSYFAYSSVVKVEDIISPFHNFELWNVMLMAQVHLHHMVASRWEVERKHLVKKWCPQYLCDLVTNSLFWYQHFIAQVLSSKTVIQLYSFSFFRFVRLFPGF